MSNRRLSQRAPGVRQRPNLRRGRRDTSHAEVATLRYAMTFVPGAVPVFTQVFRGNGCFDPDITGSGAQPTGFDQYMALYKNFRVIRSKIRVSVLSGSTAAAAGQAIVVVRADAASGASLASDPLGALCSTNATHRVVQSFPAPGVRMEMNRTTSRMLSLSPDLPDLLGDASADPAVQWHWHVTVSSFDLSSNPVVRVLCNLEYTVEFTGRKTITLS